ncbi:hypothetical protein HK099_005471 [Clydaea vesicula]|uniref:Copper transport protein n=1 Tax=Clydaea vesicula TaxID=447962 RepID=A0AAD5XYX5_9FUNG|nr:hypothetical protein HK099_005471 [Clydaea vesicula]KAJ3391981.1 hypothetical protein HDU92_008704 [Lobulomyces angularis]
MITKSQECFDSKNLSCANSVYQNATLDLSKICTSNSAIVGCSILRDCKEKGKSTSFCNEFSILGDICYSDKPSLGDCLQYKSICGISGLVGDQITPSSFNAIFNNTTILDCEINHPLTNLPPTSLVKTKVESVCKRMASMDGCSSCMQNGVSLPTCNLFKTYGNLCLQMPMNECNEWKKMCDSSPDLTSFCTSAVEDDTPPSSPTNKDSSANKEVFQIPDMLMFFHSGPVDYILFKSLVPQNSLHYAIAIVILFFLAVFYEWLHVFSILKEEEWKLKNYPAICYPYKPLNLKEVKEEDENNSQYIGLKILLLRGLFKFLLTTLSYSLMLIVMTFNIGYFFAIIIGYTVGTMCFGGLCKRGSNTISASSQEASASVCC